MCIDASETSEKIDKYISKRQYLSHCFSVKVVKGTAVNPERHSLIAESLEITSAVPLISIYIQVGIPHNSKQRNSKENNKRKQSLKTLVVQITQVTLNTVKNLKF